MNYVFYGITMKASNGKTLYLKCSNRESKNWYKPLMSWTGDVNEACLWDTYHECVLFANSYFKRFSKYSINTITINQNNLKTYDKGVTA